MGGLSAKPSRRQLLYQKMVADAEAKKQAEEEVQRSRRGRESTIRTSHAGILEEPESKMEFKRKKLLGE